MDMGILEEARFELVHGEIILEDAHSHERHVFTCRQVQKALEAIIGEAYVRMAAPVAISEHEEPEPDAAVMTRPLRDYLSLGTPLPSDVRLAVEVSDSTLRLDLRVKTGQYGSAGIPEYWVVDIPNRLLYVFRQPNEGGYGSETVLSLRRRGAAVVRARRRCARGRSATIERVSCVCVVCCVCVVRLV